MATAQHADRPPAGPDPAHCRGAEDYVLRRLESADSPLSPSGLAEEYDCGGSHMRSVLSELAQQGEIERVAQGQYVDVEPEAETNGSNDADDADGSDGFLPADDQDERMSTAEAYEEQHSIVSNASNGEDAGDDAGDEVEAVDVDDSDEDPDFDGVEDAAPAAALPMDPKTLGMLLAAALVLWVAYRALAGDADGSDESDESDESAESSVVEEAEEVAGGLMG